jgi:hypothetical protein
MKHSLKYLAVLFTLARYHVGREAVAACQSVASTGRALYVMITPARQRAVAGNSSPSPEALLFLLALYTTSVHNDLDHIVVKCFK